MKLMKSWLNSLNQPSKTRFYMDTEGNVVLDDGE